MRYNKYGNKKTVIDGHKFDSKKEAEFYLILKDKKKKGEILDFELQPEVTLQEGFEYEGKKIRPIKYKADFIVFHDGNTEIIDVKGSKKILTPAFKLKWKMLQYQLKNDKEYTVTLYI